MFSNCIQTRGCLTFTVYYCNEGYCLPWHPVLFETFIIPSANFEVQLAKQTLWWGSMHLYHSELYFYIKLTDCRHFFTCLYIRLQFKLCFQQNAGLFHYIFHFKNYFLFRYQKAGDWWAERILCQNSCLNFWMPVPYDVVFAIWTKPLLHNLQPCTVTIDNLIQSVLTISVIGTGSNLRF